MEPPIPQSAIDTVLAVDLGGTHARAAAVTAAGRIVARRQAPTAADAGRDAVLDRVAGAVTEAAGAVGLGPDVLVGVALPGAVDPVNGVLYFAPNLPGWRDVPVRDLLEGRLGRPVALGNDLNAAALGEWRYGAGRGTRHLVFIGVGTGVGGGVIVDGRLLLGRHGLAGELGHAVIALDGPPCHCGRRGCLEAHTSGWAIARDAQRLLDAGVPSLLPDLLAERGGELDGPLVTLAAQREDELAIEVLAGAGRALGHAAASFAHIFNPEVIAIGGGVIAAGPLLFDPLQEALAERLLNGFDRDLRVVPSALGQDAGLLGAAVLALENAERGTGNMG